jgi:transcriptional regulator with GAF, ATPase, and Fis domain
VGAARVSRAPKKTAAPKKAAAPKKPSESGTLRARVDALEAELDRQRNARLHLQEKLALVEREAKRYYDQYVDVEVQNANIANLYVASFRLHASLHRDEVLAAIQEIVANLVGSEELAVFERSDDGESLERVSALGLPDGALLEVKMGEGLIGRCAERGEAFVATASADGSRAASLPEPRGPGEKHISVCIPLVVEGKVTGALAIFRLLEHKRAFEDIDQELLRLLGTQAAMALYCTKLAMSAR